MRVGKSVLLSVLVLVVGLAMARPGEAQSGHQNSKGSGKATMLYHNGQVIGVAPNVYFTFYGCWDCGLPGSDGATMLILEDFASHLGGSPYFRINSTYPDVDGDAPTGQLFYGGSTADAAYSQGKDLTVSQIQGIISSQMAAGTLPVDTAGIYIVIAASDVASTATGFCTAPSSPHHGDFRHNGTPVKYAFVGNPARCPVVAAPQFVTASGAAVPSPNANLAADAIASAMAHALDEVVTNPNGDAWFDSNGLENADKCTGQFGRTYGAPNGAVANMTLGSRDYLIQANWVNVRKGACALTYP